MSLEKRQTLKKDLSKLALFTLAFGAMIGVGWVTALGSWLQQAGPLGAALAFLVGGVVMTCIALCYGELTAMMPVSGGEVAYAYRAFGVSKSFMVGWALAFGYIAISGFEAISIGMVLSFLIPAVDQWPLYQFAGATVYGSHLLLAWIFTALIAFFHLRGVRYAATLQNWLTIGFVLLCLAVILAAFSSGSVDHWQPLLPVTSEHSLLAGFLSVLITIPFWFVGFDTIPQAAEESSQSVSARTMAILIVVSVMAAALFYVLIVSALSYAGPWQITASSDLPAAKALEFALGSALWRNLVLLAALIGLLTSWNGFFLAGSRVLFALGRGQILNKSIGKTSERFGTPATAILLTAVFTALAPLMGRNALISLVNVGSLFIAIAFFGVVMSLLKLRKVAPTMDRPFVMPAKKIIPFIAAGSAAIMSLAMLIPGSPVALVWPHEMALVLFVVLLGAIFWWKGTASRGAISAEQRTYLIFGDE